MENLPPDSATVRAERGHTWQDADYLLADVVDTVRAHLAAFVNANGGKAKRPEPVPRPGQENRRPALGDRKGRSAEDVVAYLDQFRARRGE